MDSFVLPAGARCTILGDAQAPNVLLAFHGSSETAGPGWALRPTSGRFRPSWHQQRLQEWAQLGLCVVAVDSYAESTRAHNQIPHRDSAMYALRVQDVAEAVEWADAKFGSVFCFGISDGGRALSQYLAGAACPASVSGAVLDCPGLNREGTQRCPDEGKADLVHMNQGWQSTHQLRVLLLVAECDELHHLGDTLEAARLIGLRHRVECVVFKGADHCFQNLEQASEDSYCSHIPAFLQSLVSRTEDATDVNPECIVTIE